jgi:prolyl 4-hydroxylase
VVTVPSAQRALALASSGRSAEALALLEAATADPAAALLLGLWQVEGKLAARDLASARRHFARAADLGHQGAARILACLLANGSGGPADWPAAVALLDDWAARDPLARHQLALIAAMGLDAEGAPSGGFEIETICEIPQVARLPGLFSPDECRFLVDHAAPRFRPAQIFHEGQQRFVRDPVRDSDTSSFPVIYESPVVHALNRRIAAASGTEVARGETLQILRYGPGQQYRLHTDAVPGLANQRVLTLLVYLNDDYQGGETAFPDIGVSVRGRVGDGLLFANVLPDGNADPRARHVGNPVTDGIKLVASRWIRQRAPDDPREGFGRHETAAR